MEDQKLVDNIKRELAEKAYELEYKYCKQDILKNYSIGIYITSWHVVINNGTEYYDFDDSMTYVIEKLEADGYKVGVMDGNEIIIQAPIPIVKKSDSRLKILNRRRMFKRHRFNLSKE